MTKNTAATPISYEQAIAELESIVQQMETEKLPLEQSLSAYQRGAELLKLCQKALTDAEQQISILNADNALSTFSTEENH